MRQCIMFMHPIMASAFGLGNNGHKPDIYPPVTDMKSIETMK